MSKIGVVGAAGVVGSAVVYGFEKLGHQVLKHDLRMGTELGAVMDAEVVYVCVPTPSKEDGSCNTSIVESVVDELMRRGFPGYVVVKSTVSPGTTQKLIDRYQSSKLGFSPEILRERSAFLDFQNQEVCVIGTTHAPMFDYLAKQHQKLAKNIVQLSPTQAELFKYASNCLNSTLITFANSMAMVAEHCGVDYGEIKDALIKRGDVGPNYLDSNPNCRGFAGVCLKKDCSEMASFCLRNGLKVEFFADILKENALYKRTVFDGMRLE